MTERIEARKLSYVVPTAVIGTDDLGRIMVRCPECGDDATILDDGRVSCPTHDATTAFLGGALPRLEAALFPDGAP